MHPVKPVLLHVAEKPSVAKSIAAALCAGSKPLTRPSGRSNKNFIPPVYEFDASVPVYGNAKHIVTSVAGHLMSVDFKEPYNKWGSCNPVALFEAPVHYFVEESKKGLESQLLALSRTASVLVLWLDCDREGEGIAFEVIEVCLRANPGLTPQRAKFSATTARDIQNAMRTLVKPDRRLSDAVKARSELDLRLGAAFTRLQTVALGNQFNDLVGKLISYGPCQFPTLGFVVHRFREIAEFVSEPFWELQMGLVAAGVAAYAPGEEDEDQHVPPARANRHSAANMLQFSWDRARVYDEFSALILYERALHAGTATVEAVHGRSATKTKPIPMNSVDFAVLASKSLKMNSNTAAKVAEELYQRGFISYPRTETQTFDATIDLHELLAKHLTHPEWGLYTRGLLENGKFERPGGTKHDQAHPPIHPLRAALYADFTNTDHWRVYELITRHFLACCSKSALGESSKVTARLGDELFHASGLIVLERNFLDVYPYQGWHAKHLPVFVVGQSFTPTELRLHRGETTAPHLLAEHELIQLMYDNGIGTDATIPEHIFKVQERDYMLKDAQGRFTPTTLGVALLNGYDQLELVAMSKPGLRAAVEADLNSVCSGKKTAASVMAECLAQMRPVYQKASENVHVIAAAIGDMFEPIGARYAAEVVGLSSCGVCTTSMSLKLILQGKDKDPAKALFCDTCDKGYSIPKHATTIVATDIYCPICHFQVVKIGRDSGGTTMLCPRCYAQPPPEFSAFRTTHLGATSAVGTPMDCMHCSHPSCTLAGGKPPRGADATFSMASSPFTCGMNNCHGRMVVRRSNTNVFFLSCDRRDASVAGSGNSCNHVIWLPKYVTGLAVAPMEEPSSRCSTCTHGKDIVMQLDFAFSSGSVPPHMSSMSVRKIGNITYTFRTCVVCQRSELEGVNEKPWVITVSMRHALAAHAAPANVEVEDLVRLGPQLFGAPEASNAVPPLPEFLGDRFLEPDSDSRAPRKGGAAKSSARHVASFESRTARPVDASSARPSEPLGRGSACYNCGEHGHYSVNCPTKADAFSVASKTSTAAGGAGHDRECYNCGQHGHYIANCPTRTAPQLSSTGQTRARPVASADSHEDKQSKPRKCGLCKQEGHTKPKCPHNVEARWNAAHNPTAFR